MSKVQSDSTTTTQGDPVPVYRLEVEASFCVCLPERPGGRPIIVRGARDDVRVAGLVEEFGGAPEADWIDVDPARIGDLPEHLRESIAEALDRLLAFDAERREAASATA